jgi:hypothetical protein
MRRLPLEVVCRQARAAAITATRGSAELPTDWLAVQADRLRVLLDQEPAVRLGANEPRRDLKKVDRARESIRDEVLDLLVAVEDRLRAG